MAKPNGVKLAEDEKKDEKKDEKEGAKLGTDMTLEQALAFLTEIMPKLQEIMKTLGGCGGSAEPEAENLAPVELSASKEIITLKAQLDKQSAEIVHLRKEHELDSKVTQGIATLRPYGVDADAAEKQIREIAGRHGVDAVELWLSARIAGVTPEPSLSPEEFTASEDAAVSEFTKQGPEIAERAIRLSAEYDHLMRSKAGLSVDKRTYIADALEHDRILARA